jgi:SAM-dependent methyltransferase/methyltransferase-like protein
MEIITDPLGMSQLSTTDDEILAPGLPVVQSQPDFLAAIGRIRGMQPKAAERASVLEIGCGDGSNLLPLAERYPESTFTGVDGSPRLVARARQLADELHLANVTFRQQAPGEADFGDATFDYVLVSGVYSHVGAPARDRLLATCRTCLAPEGIAFVDYQAYPGWHVHEMLRSMMRYRARAARTAGERLSLGRELLQFLIASLPADDNGDGSLVAQLARSVLAQPDSSVYRRYLADDCQGFTFAEFVEHAEKHALQILGDGTAGLPVSNYFTPGLERELAAITSDELDKEHFRDVVHCTAQRQTLLCHDAIELERDPTAERMQGLQLAARLTMDEPRAPLESPIKSTFTAPSGLTVASSAPVIKTALDHLGAVWPNYVEFDELVRFACERIENAIQRATLEATPTEAIDEDRLKHNLVGCCSRGIIEVHAATQSFVARPSERPAAAALARWQAARQETVTNRKHEGVPLAAFDRHVLEQLDGTRSVQDLIAQLAAAARSGRIGLVEDGQPVPPERAEPFISQQLQASLTRLAESALLVA